MSSSAKRQHIEAVAQNLENFVVLYLADIGIQVQIIEVIAKDLFGQVVVANGTVHESVAQTPREMFSSALQDIADISMFSGVNFSLDRLIAGAVSFEFIVRYATKLDEAILPESVLPTPKDVAFLLDLFHESKQDVVVTS